MCDLSEPLRSVSLSSSSCPSKICVKCKREAACTALRQALYCQPCFHAQTFHKYRQCCAQAKTLFNGDIPERILLAFSGGNASRVLLHLATEAKRVDPHRQNTDEFIVCHVSESSIGDIVNDQLKLKEICASYSLPLLIKDIQESALLDEEFHKKNQTAKEEIASIARTNILIDTALEQKCSKIYFGDCATRLSIKALSSCAHGRGLSLSHKSQPIVRMPDLPSLAIVYPLRMHFAKELAYLIHFEKLELSLEKSVKRPPSSSINLLAERFVMELDKDFPATVSTICSTTAKLQSTQNVSACSICRFPKESSLSFYTIEALDKSCFEVLDNPTVCYGCHRLFKK